MAIPIIIIARHSLIHPYFVETLLQSGATPYPRRRRLRDRPMLSHGERDTTTRRSDSERCVSTLGLRSHPWTRLARLVIPSEREARRLVCRCVRPAES